MGVGASTRVSVGYVENATEKGQLIVLWAPGRGAVKCHFFSFYIYINRVEKKWHFYFGIILYIIYILSHYILYNNIIILSSVQTNILHTHERSE